MNRARQICDALGLDFYIGPPREEGLIYTTEINGEEFASISRYDAQLAAGGGASNDESEPTSTLAFRREWLARTGISPASACILSVRGDSMRPTLYDTDLVMIDMRRKQVRNRRIYAFVATTLATGASAAEGNLLGCIQEHFVISGVEADAAEDTVDVTFEVTNNLTYPVGGAHVMITVTHPDRPTPIATWGSQALLTIPGSLLPGESMAAETYMYVEPRAQAMIDEPGQLSAVVRVDSVANGDLVSIRSGLWASSWTEGPSGDGCP